MGIRLNYFTDAGGEERVRIEGANGEPLFTSEGYTRTEGSVHAVQLVAKAFKSGDVIVENGPGWQEPETPSEDEETGDEMVVEESGIAHDALD
jgi:uncharacterized protein YegP (UPF0339 family)